MEIINAHVHLIELEKIDIKETKNILESTPIYSQPESLIPLMFPESLDEQMKEAGITRSVLYAVDAPVIYASNEYVAKLCDDAPDKRIGFASVNPLKENASEIIEKAIKNLGLKGCKLHPPLQNFMPNDEKVFPFYETLQKLNIPVVFHIGTTPFGASVKLSYANPILIDDVACAFPKLKIMLTHLGTLWDREAFMVVEKNPNVFIDTSACLYEIPQLLTQNLIDRIGEDKIIFGTDYPTPLDRKNKHRMKSFVDCINALNIDDKIKEKIFSKNFKKMMGLTK